MIASEIGFAAMMNNMPLLVEQHVIFVNSRFRVKLEISMREMHVKQLERLSRLERLEHARRSGHVRRSGLSTTTNAEKKNKRKHNLGCVLLSFQVICPISGGFLVFFLRLGVFR